MTYVHTFNLATQAEAEAGVDTKSTMTPLRVAQAIAALGSAGTDINSTLTEANILASLGSLTGTPCFYRASDTSALYWCPSASVAVKIVEGSTQPSFRGVFADLDAVYAGVTDPVEGDQAIVDQLLFEENAGAQETYDTVLQYSSSYWRPTKDLFIVVANRDAGTTSASEQHATYWGLPLPAKFLRGCKLMVARVIVRSDGTTNAINTLTFRLGSSATDTNNTNIGSTAGTYVTASEGAAATEFWFRVFGDASVRPLTTLIANGHFTGDDISAGNDPSTVTMATDTWDDALNLSVGVTMAGTTDTPTLSVIWQFIF